MKVIVISGSRNPSGQTASAADAFLAGVADAGGVGEQIFLPQLNIQSCRQCKDDGWGDCTGRGQCCIDDDMIAVVDKMREADGFVFATPVYFSDLSESMKAFTDRLRRTCLHDDGARSITGKPAVGICVAGGGGGGAPTCARSLEWVLQTCKLDVVDMIPARRQNLEMKKQVLRVAGKWFVEQL